MPSITNLALVACVASALASAGCSISASSGSSSDSITASSKSISNSISSSSPDGSSSSEQAYREDVRDYTASAARSGRSAEELESGLAAVAEQHGVTNWEADAATYVGIGQGLRRAGLAPVRVERWVDELGHGSAAHVPADQLIQQGYDDSRS